jgi:pyruvate kinase
MLNKHDRRTKLIWSFDQGCLHLLNHEIIAQGDFECLRVVFHGGLTPEFLKQLEQIKGSKNKNGENVSIMIDLSPRPRAHVSATPDEIELAFGQNITMATTGTDADIQVDCDSWDSFLAVDELIYFGFGNFILKVISIKNGVAHCRVEQGGRIFHGMEVHVPSTRQKVSLSEFDSKELKKIFQMGIDAVLLPSGPEDAQTVIELSGDKKPWILLKVNSQSSLDSYKEWIDGVQGVFISRMELAMHMEPARIPIITKEIIEHCNNEAKIVLVASEMLGSMRSNITPTRAEVSDIANAVFDGADAVVLSEDIPYGPHYIESIAVMHRSAQDAQSYLLQRPNWRRVEPKIADEMDAVSYGAYMTAQRVNAKAIVCLTHQGNTAVRLASFRTPTPIIAVTFNKQLATKLSFVRGVRCLVLDEQLGIDEVLPVVKATLEKSSWLRSGDRFIFVTVTLSSLSATESNLFTVQNL